MPTADKHPAFVTALARGLEVLRCFTPEQSELGTTEIARMTGLPQPTVWRLCFTLTQGGYLLPGRVPDRLRVGPAVLTLGHAAAVHAGIGEAALPLMQALADEFGASVSLGERDRLSMVIVQRAEAADILKVNLHVGATLALVRSSMGWAYLCALPDAERAAALAELKALHKSGWAEVQADLDTALHDYRRLGLVFNLGRSHRDINAIGVPVLPPRGGRAMALTCGGARSAFGRDLLARRVAPALKALAAQIAPLVTAGNALPRAAR